MKNDTILLTAQIALREHNREQSIIAVNKCIIRSLLDISILFCFVYYQKAQVGKDQEKAQSAKDSHSKNPRWEKTKLTIRYLYHENIS